MTVEELVKLTEAVLRNVTVRDIRNGLSEVSLDGLEDTDWSVLMRFVAGERVDPRPVRVTDYAGNVLIDGDPPPPMLDPLPNRTAEGKRMTSAERWERAERTEDQKELVLGVQRGEEAEVDLTGVTLP